MTEKQPVFRGDRLKQMRIARQMTQSDLNAWLHTGKGNQVNRYENGKHDPTVEILLRMANVLQVSTDYLLGRVDKPEEYFHSRGITVSEYKLLTAIRHSTPEMQSLLRVLLSAMSAAMSGEEEEEIEEGWGE